MRSSFHVVRVLCAIFISAAELVFLSLGPVSCSMGAPADGGPSFHPEKSDTSGASGLTVQRAAPPVLESFTVDAADAMLLRFDKAVSVSAASLSPAAGGEGGETSIAVSGGPDGDGTSVRLKFAEETQVGSVYDLHAVATDNDGNSLTFTLTFDAFNPRLPGLILCELRNAYSSKANKYEFVRLYCATAGNLSGLELVSAGDGEAQKFAFPPIEVDAGEYVCVHLRKMKDEGGNWMQEGMVDEDAGDRAASTAVDSSGEAWDFWQDNQKSRLSPSDIVLLRNRADGRVLDAFLFRDPKKDAADWDGKFQAVCRAVAESGCWLDADGQATASFASAFVAEGITSSAVTRTMKRRNLAGGPACAADWYVEQAR